MECISSLILLMASIATPNTAPIVTILMLLTWQIGRMRPCLVCGVIMYALLVSTLMFEDRGEGYSLFSCLRLSPVQMEFNLLLKAKYDPFLGLCRTIANSRYVFSPSDTFSNFLRAFGRYLLEPNYGKIYHE